MSSGNNYNPMNPYQQGNLGSRTDQSDYSKGMEFTTEQIVEGKEVRGQDSPLSYKAPDSMLDLLKSTAGFVGEAVDFTATLDKHAIEKYTSDTQRFMQQVDRGELDEYNEYDEQGNIVGTNWGKATQEVRKRNQNFRNRNFLFTKKGNLDAEMIQWKYEAAAVQEWGGNVKLLWANKQQDLLTQGYDAKTIASEFNNWLKTIKDPMVRNQLQDWSEESAFTLNIKAAEENFKLFGKEITEAADVVAQEYLDQINTGTLDDAQFLGEDNTILPETRAAILETLIANSKTFDPDVLREMMEDPNGNMFKTQLTTAVEKIYKSLKDRHRVILGTEEQARIDIEIDSAALLKPRARDLGSDYVTDTVVSFMDKNAASPYLTPAQKMANLRKYWTNFVLSYGTDSFKNGMHAERNHKDLGNHLSPVIMEANVGQMPQEMSDQLSFGELRAGLENALESFLPPGTSPEELEGVLDKITDDFLLSVVADAGKKEGTSRRSNSNRNGGGGTSNPIEQATTVVAAQNGVGDPMTAGDIKDAYAGLMLSDVTNATSWMTNPTNVNVDGVRANTAITFVMDIEGEDEGRVLLTNYLEAVETFGAGSDEANRLIFRAEEKLAEGGLDFYAWRNAYLTNYTAKTSRSHLETGMPPQIEKALTDNLTAVSHAIKAEGAMFDLDVPRFRSNMELIESLTPAHRAKFLSKLPDDELGIDVERMYDSWRAYKNIVDTEDVGGDTLMMWLRAEVNGGTAEAGRDFMKLFTPAEYAELLTAWNYHTGRNTSDPEAFIAKRQEIMQSTGLQVLPQTMDKIEELWITHNKNAFDLINALPNSEAWLNSFDLDGDGTSELTEDNAFAFLNERLSGQVGNFKEMVGTAVMHWHLANNMNGDLANSANIVMRNYVLPNLVLHDGVVQWSPGSSDYRINGRNFNLNKNGKFDPKQGSVANGAMKASQNTPLTDIDPMDFSRYLNLRLSNWENLSDDSLNPEGGMERDEVIQTLLDIRPAIEEAIIAGGRRPVLGDVDMLILDLYNESTRIGGTPLPELVREIKEKGRFHTGDKRVMILHENPSESHFTLNDRHGDQNARRVEDMTGSLDIRTREGIRNQGMIPLTVHMKAPVGGTEDNYGNEYPAGLMGVPMFIVDKYNQDGVYRGAINQHPVLKDDRMIEILQRNLGYDSTEEVREMLREAHESGELYQYESGFNHLEGRIDSETSGLTYEINKAIRQRKAEQTVGSRIADADELLFPNAPKQVTHFQRNSYQDDITEQQKRVMYPNREIEAKDRITDAERGSALYRIFGGLNPWYEIEPARIRREARELIMNDRGAILPWPALQGSLGIKVNNISRHLSEQNFLGQNHYETENNINPVELQRLMDMSPQEFWELPEQYKSMWGMLGQEEGDKLLAFDHARNTVALMWNELDKVERNALYRVGLDGPRDFFQTVVLTHKPRQFYLPSDDRTFQEDNEIRNGIERVDGLVVNTLNMPPAPTPSEDAFTLREFEGRPPELVYDYPGEILTSFIEEADLGFESYMNTVENDPVLKERLEEVVDIAGLKRGYKEAQILFETNPSAIFASGHENVDSFYMDRLKRMVLKTGETPERIRAYLGTQAVLRDLSQEERDKMLIALERFPARKKAERYVEQMRLKLRPESELSPTEMTRRHLYGEKLSERDQEFNDRLDQLKRDIWNMNIPEGLPPEWLQPEVIRVALQNEKFTYTEEYLKSIAVDLKKKREEEEGKAEEQRVAELMERYPDQGPSPEFRRFTEKIKRDERVRETYIDATGREQEY